MKQQEIIVLPGPKDMAEYLVDLIGKKIAVKGDGGYLSLALSGGSTPRRILESISRHYKRSLDWNRIRFFQVDERCVPPEHPESNYKMIRQSLFDPLEIAEDQIFRMRGENDPPTEALRYEKIISENLPIAGRWPVFDVILLGLGEDGHTASLFPGDSGILHSENYCEVARHLQTGQLRITLTLQVINHAKQVIFMVTGQEKAKMVAQVINNPEKNKYPASLVNPQNGSLIWLLDADAAELLDRQEI